jgi:type 1 glutamine amidotransferase
VVTQGGYPKDPSVFERCDAVVIFSDGGGGHPFMSHLKEIDALAEKGVGVACLHYAVEIPKGEPGDFFLKWIGGYFEAHWSVNPHWTAKFDKIPEHPVTRGVKPFESDDEWYYHMRFRDKMEGVTALLSALPPEATLKRPDGAHSNNPHVRAAVLERKEPQHVAWASERPNGQRGFGFTGGHWHWNWAEPNFRKLVLNAIIWVAHGEVPAHGVADKSPTMKDLEANQEYEQPKNFDRAGTMKKFHIND